MDAEAVKALFARAAGRRVFGYDSRTGRGGEVKGAVVWPDELDRGCVEGDAEWVKVGEHAEAGRCSSCGMSILWAKLKSGRAIPLDAAPRPGGKFIVKMGLAVPPPRKTPKSVPRYDTHFKSCPHAAEHRR